MALESAVTLFIGPFPYKGFHNKHPMYCTQPMKQVASMWTTGKWVWNSTQPTCSLCTVWVLLWLEEHSVPHMCEKLHTMSCISQA